MAQRWTLLKFCWNRRTDLFLDNCLCKRRKANLKMIIQHRPNLGEDDEKADQFSRRNQEDEPCCVSEMNIMWGICNWKDFRNSYVELYLQK